jgi:hypothetical protein
MMVVIQDLVFCVVVHFILLADRNRGMRLAVASDGLNCGAEFLFPPC